MEQIIERAMIHVRKGCLSDPPGVELYAEVERRNGLTQYRSFRGTNSNEGTVHKDLRSKFGSNNSGPRLTYCILLDFAARLNMKAVVRNKGGADHGHQDPWLLDEIADLYELLERDTMSEWLSTTKIDLATNPPFLIMGPIFEAGKYPSFDSSAAASFTPSLRFVAEKLNLRIPVMSIHTKEEMALFKKLEAEYGRDFIKMVDKWNSLADGIFIFSKTKYLLERHVKVRDRAINRESSLQQNDVNVEHMPVDVSSAGNAVNEEQIFAVPAETPIGLELHDTHPSNFTSAPATQEFDGANYQHENVVHPENASLNPPTLDLVEVSVPEQGADVPEAVQATAIINEDIPTLVRDMAIIDEVIPAPVQATPAIDEDIPAPVQATTVIDESVDNDSASHNSPTENYSFHDDWFDDNIIECTLLRAVQADDFETNFTTMMRLIEMENIDNEPSGSVASNLIAVAIQEEQNVASETSAVADQDNVAAQMENTEISWFETPAGNRITSETRITADRSPGTQPAKKYRATDFTVHQAVTAVLIFRQATSSGLSVRDAHAACQNSDVSRSTLVRWDDLLNLMGFDEIASLQFLFEDEETSQMTFRDFASLYKKLT
eukprot:Partr_v1_DN27656_c2_g1_i3_m64859